MGKVCLLGAYKGLKPFELTLRTVLIICLLGAYKGLKLI